MKRDKLTKTEAIRRISSQLPISIKIKKADIIINNSKTLTYIKKQVQKIKNVWPN